MELEKTLKKKVALERGRRIKLARTLTNLTRKEMQLRYDINANTIHAWEKGTNCLTEKNTSKLLDAFHQEGLAITEEWLLSGEDPRVTQDLNAKNHQLNDILNIQRDLKIFDEINYFRHHNPNSTSMMITDNALDPIFCAGDYVGGINVSKNHLISLVGEFCIITTEDNQIFARKIFSYEGENRFMVGATNPYASLNPANTILPIQTAAPITRHWALSRLAKI